MIFSSEHYLNILSFMAPPTQQMDKFDIKSSQIVWKIYTHQYGCACFVCCTHVCIHWYMHMKKPEQDSGCSLSLSNLILETGFLTESGECHFLSRLVARRSQWHSWSFVLPALSTGVTGTCSHAQLSHGWWGSGLCFLFSHSKHFTYWAISPAFGF